MTTVLAIALNIGHLTEKYRGWGGRNVERIDRSHPVGALAQTLSVDKIDGQGRLQLKIRVRIMKTHFYKEIFYF